ncbi:hypothetical protein ACV566_06040 [Staphylococcus aureus]
MITPIDASQAWCLTSLLLEGHLSNIISKLQHYSIEAKPGICIIGEVVGYTENTPKSYDSMKQFYVVSRINMTPLCFCEHLYDEGYGCLLNPNDTWNGTYHSFRNMITMMHLLSSKKM